jgi:hypothetical protein
MDPYLEMHWRDVHASLVIYIRDSIQEQLPSELRARVEERVVLETPEGIGNWLFPDIRVVENPSRPSPRSGAAAATAGVPEPLLIDAEREPLTETFIEIIDTASGNRVVTVVEVLSPSNKLPGEGRDAYLRKQRELCCSDTNLVEIDLLRQGRHTAAFPPENIRPSRRTPYLVCVRRVTRPGKAEVYLVSLEDRLPAIKVPLRPRDADVRLDLQALLEQVYQRGRYEGDIDYTKDPDPPLSPQGAAWVDDLLRQKGLRTAPARSRRRRRPPDGR